MPKFKREKLTVRDKEDSDSEIRLEFDAYVDTEGEFYMKFTDAEIEKFKAADVKLETNPKRIYGYAFAKTYEELLTKVKNLAGELISRKCTERKIVILYGIQTMCNYAKDLQGNIVANVSEAWTGMKYPEDERNRHIYGTIDIHATQRLPYGILMYAAGWVKETYLYKSGRTKTEYVSLYYGKELSEEALRTGYNLRYLHSIPCIDMPKNCKQQEIDYTEEVAAVFVGMIKSICLINERIKDFLNPQAIQQIADTRGNMFALNPKTD